MRESWPGFLNSFFHFTALNFNTLKCRSRPARARACGAEFAPTNPYGKFLLDPAAGAPYANFSRNPPTAERCPALRPGPPYAALSVALQSHQRYRISPNLKRKYPGVSVCPLDKIFILWYNIKKRIWAGRITCKL